MTKQDQLNVKAVGSYIKKLKKLIASHEDKAVERKDELNIELIRMKQWHKKNEYILNIKFY